MTELKPSPCRYCSATTRVIDHDFRKPLKAVHCDECGASGPWSGASDDAIRLHNQPRPMKVHPHFTFARMKPARIRWQGRVSWWRRWAAIYAFATMLTGCGQLEVDPAPPGIYVDATYAEHLQAEFEEVEACSEMSASFDDLAVVIMPRFFPCEWSANGCMGEFTSPNLIKIGIPFSWKHEVLHYLLYVNTGNADSGHGSDMFWRCT